MENRNRLEIQIKQQYLESILIEFRKAKMRCLELCERLNKDLPNLEQYQIMEVTCTRKIDSMDVLGVIKLKKQLASRFGQISVAEKEMTYELQKNSFKKTIKTSIIASRQVYNQQQLGPFQIPNYQGRVEPNQNKIDRLASFILSLGKSMNALRKCMSGQWQEEEFFKYEPQYLQMMRKIEQFKMRDQELIHIIERKFEHEIQQIIKKGQKIPQKQQDQYYVVKISKKDVENACQKKKLAKDKEFQVGQQYHPVSMLEPKRKTTAKKMPLEKINQEKIGEGQRIQLTKNANDTSIDLQMQSFQKSNNQFYSRVSNRLMDSSQIEQQGENGNYVYMVKRISPDSQLNSSIISSISSLRSMRKKVFDDDIWDQFQKI